jgi:tetratricopeptide (TPR) repeat protein
MNPKSQARQLSLALIVRDAADALADTLESVRGLADETIVVDTGSADNTRQVAERAGAKVYTAAWVDDFAAARNHALQLCAGDWVLSLDAGERLLDGDARGLRAFVQSQSPGNTAYALLVRLPVQPREIGAEQVAMARLLPNDPAIRYAGRVHESIAGSLSTLGFALEGLPFCIHRGLRELQPERKTLRAQRNLRLAEIELRERGPTPALLCCIGEACQTLGKTEEATQAFRQAIALADPGSSEMLAAYYGLIAALEGAAGGKPAQLAACMAALETYPLDAQLLCAAGGYMQSLGQPELAMRSYETAARYGTINPLVWHLEGMLEIATACYAQALEQANQLSQAEGTLVQALGDYPASTRLRRQLLALYVRQGKRKLALAEVDLLPPETPYREALVSAVRGGCLAAAQHWIPARAYLEAAYRGGSRDALCLQWYAVALMAEGDWDAAKPVVSQLQNLDPGHPELSNLQRRLAAAPAAETRSIAAALSHSGVHALPSAAAAM